MNPLLTLGSWTIADERDIVERPEIGRPPLTRVRHKPPGVVGCRYAFGRPGDRPVRIVVHYRRSSHAELLAIRDGLPTRLAAPSQGELVYLDPAFGERLAGCVLLDYTPDRHPQQVSGNGLAWRLGVVLELVQVAAVPAPPDPPPPV